jgi:hypothetical protein
VGRTALRWLLALGLLGCLSAHAAGPVWAIRGAHNTVYLAGSIHVLPADDTSLPPAFERAYADSAKLVMELDLGKLDPMEAGEWMLEKGALPPGTKLRTVLGEQRYGRVAAAAASLGMNMLGLDLQRPWVVGLEITEYAYSHEGYDADQGVEEQLVARARADGKPTGGLETLPEELAGLVGLPQQDQVRMLDQTLDELQDIKAEMRDIVGAWRRGDAAHLAALLSTEYQSFPALYKPLVTDRNQLWLPQLQEMLRGKDNVLVVVGALHVVGEGGLLELLRKQGYTVKQLD